MTQKGAWPPEGQLDKFGSWHWFHSERSSTASIAQWGDGKWHVVGETDGISPREMYRRGWEYLAPCERPHSDYIDEPLPGGA